MGHHNRYDALMERVCVGLGYCGGIVEGKPSHVDHYIPKSGPVTAQQFADWVLMAEGHDLVRWQHHREAIVAAFIRIMGAEVVDANTLQWSD